MNDHMGVGDKLSVRKIAAVPSTPQGDLARIQVLHDYAEKLGIGRNHFMISSNILTVRRFTFAAVRRQAREFFEGRLPEDPREILAAVLGVPELRLAAADMVGRFDNLVVDDGHEFVVDAFQNLEDLFDLAFHAIGTGTTAANAADTTLETEDLLGNADRGGKGTQTEAGAKIYSTVKTTTQTTAGPDAITEAGLLSANAVGVLFSRQVFAAINLSLNDSIETTWEITVS